MFSCLLAALVHDFEHLGFNNDLLVRIGHQRALVHNDRAPNENHHVAATFRVMQRPECNFCQVHKRSTLNPQPSTCQVHNFSTRRPVKARGIRLEGFSAPC